MPANTPKSCTGRHRVIVKAPGRVRAVKPLSAGFTHELPLTYQIVAEDGKALSRVLVIRIGSVTDGQLVIIVKTEWGRQR